MLAEHAQQVIDSRSNTVSLWTEGTHRCIIKRYEAKPRTFKSVRYRMLATLGSSIPIEYMSPEMRREYESNSLALWSQHGFLVPAEVDLPAELRETKAPVLAEEALDGPTLNAHLKHPDVSMEGKWNAIKDVLVEMRARHSFALNTEEHRLIHYDSNLRNIILTAAGPARIDFEMGRLYEDIDRSAARETHKLVLEIAGALSRQHLTVLVDIAFEIYGIRHILRRIADSTLRRTLARHLERRARRRYRDDPHRVTTFELAREIDRRLNPTMPKDTVQACAVGTGRAD